MRSADAPIEIALDDRPRAGWDDFVAARARFLERLAASPPSRKEPVAARGAGGYARRTAAPVDERRTP